MALSDPPLPLVFSRQEALRAGLSRRQIDRRAGAGMWTPLRRGQFAPYPLDDDARWKAEVLAVTRSHTRQLVLAGASAARAWRLPRPLPPAPPLTFIADRPPVRRTAELHVLVSSLDESDVCVFGAVPVTSLVRTLVDCCRSLRPHDALAMVDAAVRAGSVGVDELADAVERQRGRPGIARARTVIALADPRRETPFESWSAWSFHDHGVPQPLWQPTLLDEGGAFLGRPDGWWEPCLAGEADGKAKYRLAALERGGLDAEGLAAVLDEERARENGLRRAGAQVVRWGPVEVLDRVRAAALARHLLARIGRGESFRGRVVP